MADAAALKAQANTAFAAKDFPRASELYTQAIALDGANAVLYSNRSASRASLKEWEGALGDAEKAIELDSKFVKGYARKGAALHGMRRYEDAVFAYEDGLQIDPSNAPLKKGLEDVRQRLAASGPPDPSNSLGNLFAAPDLLAKLTANPKTRSMMNDQALVDKVKLLQAQAGAGGKVDIGAMMQDPRMMTVLGVLMGIDLQAFERPEGSSEMPPGARDQDGDVNMDMPSASTSTSSSKPAAAPPKSTPAAAPRAPTPEPEADADDEEAQAKKAALALKAEGTDAYKRRDFDVAVEKFEKAWETWQGDVTFLTNLSAVYFEKGDYAKCIEACDKAVEEGRSLRVDYKIIAKVLGRTGSAYERQNDLANAIKFYGKSLTEHRTPDILAKLREAEKRKKDEDIKAYIDPELAEKAREEGNVAFKAGSFADAVKHYTEAIQRLPSDPRGYNNRSAAYTKLAALPEALKDADKAIEVDPTFVKAYIRKSMVLVGMKEANKALAACQAATEADTENKHTREIEAQMQKCMMDAYTERAGETDEQTLERAMRDPEVAKIMQDGVMQSILQQAQSDPRALQDHMKNPMIKAKIQKLIAAGIIKTR